MGSSAGVSLSTDGGASWGHPDDSVTFTLNYSGIPTLSGDGRTVFITDRNGEGGTLRLIAGHWIPVEVIDTGENQPNTALIPGTPDTGVGGQSTGTAMSFASAMALAAVGTFVILRPDRRATSSTMRWNR